MFCNKYFDTHMAHNPIDEVINSCYKVGLYTRLSVEDGDEEELNSIGNQRKIAEDFLLDRSDLSLEKVYKDNGYTEAFKSHVVRVGSNRVKMIPEDERIIIPETHEPIISREEFFNARNVIKSNEKTSQNNQRNIFTSLLVCGCCGNKLKKGKPQNKNWLCSSARYQDKTQCSEIRINEEALYEIILRAINIQFSLAEVRVGKVESVSNEKTRKEKKLNELKRDIENIEILITNIYEDYLNKIITKEEFLDKKAQYNSHIKDLNEQIEKTEDEISSMKIKERIGNNIENFKNLYNLDDLSEELLNELIEKIVVMPDKKIKIIWKYDDIFKGIIDFKKLAG